MPENKVKSQKSKVKSVIQNSKVKAGTEKTVKPVVKVAKKTTKVEAAMPIETKTAKKGTTGTLKIDVYDTKGKIVETIDLPKEVFGAKVNKSLIAQAVRVYLANQRRGSA